jgi:hypothetical protein
VLITLFLPRGFIGLGQQLRRKKRTASEVAATPAESRT